MRRGALLFLCLVGLTLGCRADVAFTKIHSARFTGYIVPKEKADGWMREYNDPQWVDASGGWEPSPAQCVEAEKAVRAYLAGVQKNIASGFPGYPADTMKWETGRVDEIVKSYPQYVVQFTGITVGGTREIFCNYSSLPAKSDIDPQRNFVFVYAGGSRYWQVVYDPAKKSCSRLMINGD